MKISELPKEIREKALEYQRKSGRNLEADLLCLAFSWINTEEGWAYWHELDRALDFTEVDIKSDKPKQYQTGIDTFTRAEANLTKDEILAICKFNIDKYNWRKKDQDKEDFKKIIDYANWALKNL